MAHANLTVRPDDRSLAAGLGALLNDGGFAQGDVTVVERDPNIYSSSYASDIVCERGEPTVPPEPDAGEDSAILNGNAPGTCVPCNICSRSRRAHGVRDIGCLPADPKRWRRPLPARWHHRAASREDRHGPRLAGARPRSNYV
jgi:hypothetical protein